MAKARAKVIHYFKVPLKEAIKIAKEQGQDVTYVNVIFRRPNGFEVDIAKIVSPDGRKHVSIIDQESGEEILYEDAESVFRLGPRQILGHASEELYLARRRHSNDEAEA